MGGDDAQSCQRPSPEQEPKQEKTEERLTISVFFSPFQYEELVNNANKSEEDVPVFYDYNFGVTDHSTFGDPIYHYLYWDEGKASSSKKDKVFFIDCQSILKDMAVCKKLDTSDMIRMLGKCVNRVYTYLEKKLTTTDKIKVKMNVAGYHPLEDLVFGLIYLCNHTKSENIFDKDFLYKATVKFSLMFSNLETNGVSFEVEYSCLFIGYHVYNIYTPPQDSGSTDKPPLNDGNAEHTDTKPKSSSKKKKKKKKRRRAVGGLGARNNSKRGERAMKSISIGVPAVASVLSIPTGAAGAVLSISAEMAFNTIPNIIKTGFTSKGTKASAASLGVQLLFLPMTYFFSIVNIPPEATKAAVYILNTMDISHSFTKTIVSTMVSMIVGE